MLDLVPPFQRAADQMAPDERHLGAIGQARKRSAW
jgi:hypothetical protein